MTRVREVEYDDLDAVGNITSTIGWDRPTLQDWKWLWEENPALRGANVRRGWVLEDDNNIVGFVGNIAQAYQFGERRLIAAAAGKLVVMPAFRGSSLLLMLAHAKQQGVELLLNTTAAPHVSKISEFLKFRRIPQADYNRSYYWVLSPRSFAYSALRKKRWPVVAAPVLELGLRVEEFVRRRRQMVGACPLTIRRVTPSSIGVEFDGLWSRKVAEGPRLLGVRDRQTLRWHFRDRGGPKAPFLVSAYDDTCLAGYVAVVHQDAPDVSLSRARVADVFVAGDDPQVIRALVRAACVEARKDGAAMLEVVGFPPHIHSVLHSLKPFERRDQSWPFLFKSPDPVLEKALQSETSWYASLYDGDGTL